MSEPTDLALTRWETVVEELAAIRELLEKGEPDLTLVEADVRNVATIMELTAELRLINAFLGKINDRQEWLEKVVREIALGLGVPTP